MRGVAVEGLFPPHRPLPDHVKGKLTTRAKFIEQVLRSEEFPIGEGIVGRVAQTGRAELIADATQDPTIVQHDDPNLAVRSVIAVPMTFRDRFFGVLVVANPVDNRLFTEMEATLMQSLAEQAALSLQNAESLNLQIERNQLDLDLSIASGIQQMLLPSQSTVFPGSTSTRATRRPRGSAATSSTSSPCPRRASASPWPTSRARESRPRSTWRSAARTCARSRRGTFRRPTRSRAQPRDGRGHPRRPLRHRPLLRDRCRGQHRDVRPRGP
jgi:hypothetical protein